MSSVLSQAEETSQVPEHRANVKKTKDKKREKAPKKWKKDDKVWMRESSNDTFDFIKYVVAWDYDENRGGWDYQLKDEAGNVYGSWVQETNTKKA